MSSVFNSEDFMSTTVPEALDTSYTPIPDGEYEAMIDDGEKWGDVREVENKKDGSIFHVFDCQFIINDPALAEKMNLNRIMVRGSMFLDLDNKGALTFGANQNTKLGRLLESCRIPAPWSIGMLQGAGPLLIRVSQQPSKEPGDDRIFNRVERFAPLT